MSVTSPTADTRPPLALALGSLLRADATVLRHSVRTLILNLAVPILILVITNLGRGKLALNSAGFDIGMALTYGLVASSLIGYSINVARDRELGVFQRLRVTPAPTWTILASRLTIQVVANLIMTAVVLAVGSAIHRVTFSAGTYLVLVMVALLGSAVCLSIGQAIVGLIGSAAVVNAVGRVLYIVLVLIGLLGSTGVLGDTMKTVASWSPVGALTNLFAAATNASGWDTDVTRALIASAIYTAAGLFLGIRWFHWAAR
jgi:ABC-2 type transport system permease protein